MKAYESERKVLGCPKSCLFYFQEISLGNWTKQCRRIVRIIIVARGRGVSREENVQFQERAMEKDLWSVKTILNINTFDANKIHLYLPVSPMELHVFFTRNASTLSNDDSSNDSSPLFCSIEICIIFVLD